MGETGKRCAAHLRRMHLLVYATTCLAATLPPTINTSAAQAGQSQGSTMEANKSEIALKDLADVVRRLRRASLDLIDEVEQRDMVVVGMPLLIEPIPERKDPNPGSMEEMIVLGNAQPPRKKWVDITMSELDKLVTLLKREQDAVAITAEKQSDAATPTAALKAVTSDIEQHCNSLKTLTEAQRLENLPIGKEALAIYQDTAKIEKPWRDLLAAIRH